MSTYMRGRLMSIYVDFAHAVEASIRHLQSGGVPVRVERWQGHETKGDPSLETIELLNLNFSVPLYRDVVYQFDDPLPEAHELLSKALALEIEPNYEWADEHFLERVGGKPLNPDPSYVRWPWWRGQESSKQAGEKFTHTYSERFWPRYARRSGFEPLKGIRYEYGDLQDVLELLTKEPYTRQAYLPIFFPEDTGSIHRGRIPCTLGYQFLMRDDLLHMWYHIRSCDAIRHFRDDLYLAVKLQLWVLNQLQLREPFWQGVKPGSLFFTAYSFHYHRGDEHHLRAKA